METIYQYFIIENGHSVGPFLKEQLLGKGVHRDSPIWREGLDDWVAAYTLPELADLFSQTASPYYNVPPNYGTPPQQPPQNGFRNQGNYQPHYQPAPTNWLPLAIVGTVLGVFTSCLGIIFGAIGINYASDANKYYRQQLDDLGDQANKTAKTMTIISLIIDGLGILGIIGYSCFFGFL